MARPVDLDSLAADAQRNCAKLPDHSYAFIPERPQGLRIVRLVRGVARPVDTDLDRDTRDTEHAEAIVRHFNSKLGVTPAQDAAMLFGSMFGFDKHGADVDRYRADGSPVRPLPKSQRPRLFRNSDNVQMELCNGSGSFTAELVGARVLLRHRGDIELPADMTLPEFDRAIESRVFGPI